jgi:hypothetical protein
MWTFPESPLEGKSVTYDDYVETLRAAGYKITPPQPPPPVHKCMLCDVTDENDWLTDITVMTAYGEEGFAEEKRYVCEEHVEDVTSELIKMGFGSHRHGGINFLEDSSCPGYEKMELCPTPESDDEDGP